MPPSHWFVSGLNCLNFNNLVFLLVCLWKTTTKQKKLLLDFVFFLWTRAVIIHDKGLIGLFAVCNHHESEMFHKETRFKFSSPTVQFYIQLLSWPSTFPWAGIGLVFVSIFPFWRLHCCAACWNSKRTGDVSPRFFFPQPRWIKICHRQCPSRLLGASQQAQPDAALSQSGKWF